MVLIIVNVFRKNDQMRQTVGLIGGSFKPFTKGHYFLVENAAKIADKVILLVSTTDRVRKGEMPIFWNGQMETIWKTFIERSLPKNVEVVYTNNPLTSIFKILGDANNDENNHNSYVLFGDIEDTAKNFPEKSLQKYFPRLLSNDQIDLRGFDREKNINISGTMMRDFVAKNDIESFTRNLPAPIQKWGQEIFDILKTSIDKISDKPEPKKKKIKKEGIVTEVLRNFNISHFKSLPTVEEKLAYTNNILPLLGAGSSRSAYALGSNKVLKIAGNARIAKIKKDKPDNQKANSAFNKTVEAGKAQNKAEAETYTHPKIKSITTKIYDFGEDYSWLITELVKPLSSKYADGRFVRTLTNIPIDDSYFMTYINDEEEVGIEKAIQGFVDNILMLIKYEPKIVNSLPKKYLPDDVNTSGGFEDFEEKWTGPIMEMLNDVLHNETFIAARQLNKETEQELGDLFRPDHWGHTEDGRLVVLDYGLTDDVSADHYEATGLKGL
jgi:cytidyltransferase-like protein